MAATGIPIGAVLASIPMKIGTVLKQSITVALKKTEGPSESRPIVVEQEESPLLQALKAKLAGRQTGSGGASVAEKMAQQEKARKSAAKKTGGGFLGEALKSKFKNVRQNNEDDSQSEAEDWGRSRSPKPGRKK